MISKHQWYVKKTKNKKTYYGKPVGCLPGCRMSLDGGKLGEEWNEVIWEFKDRLLSNKYLMHSQQFAILCGCVVISIMQQ